MKTRTEQYSHFGERNVLLPQFENFLRDKARLVTFTFSFDQGWFDAFVTPGKEIFGLLILGVDDNLVGEVKNRLGAAVIFFQFNDFGTGEQDREL